MDFEELRQQPLGQQQAAAQAEQSCWPETSLSWPSAVWRESRVMDFQLGDYHQDCKWCLNTAGSSAKKQCLALGKGAFFHALSLPFLWAYA